MVDLRVVDIGLFGFHWIVFFNTSTIIIYGFIILVVYKLLGGLWNKITLDEEEEVQKFTQKIEMLKSSKDFYDVGNTSREYLSFLNDNIDDHVINALIVTVLLVKGQFLKLIWFFIHFP